MLVYDSTITTQAWQQSEVHGGKRTRVPSASLAPDAVAAEIADAVSAQVYEEDAPQVFQ